MTGSGTVDVALLRREIRDVMSSGSLLRAAAVLYPFLDDVVEPRCGRAVAAQLATLGLRRHLWFSYDGEHLGPAGILATRRPDPVDAPGPDEERLLTLLFAGQARTRIAESRPRQDWADLTRAVRAGVIADGMGWRRRERYRYLRRLTRLRGAMYEYKQPHPGWSEDPDLHRSGAALAVLFAVERGRPHWPEPPDEELHLSSLLPVACHLGIMASVRTP